MVRWNWNAKFGEMIYNFKNHQTGKKVRYVVSIYKGNCLAVLLHTYYKKDEDGKRKVFYEFRDYLNNEIQLKSNLGLTKGNSYNYYEEVSLVRLNTYYTRTAFERKELMLIAKNFTKAGIKVSLYYKEPKPEKKKKEED